MRRSIALMGALQTPPGSSLPQSLGCLHHRSWAHLADESSAGLFLFSTFIVLFTWVLGTSPRHTGWSLSWNTFCLILPLGQDSCACNLFTGSQPSAPVCLASPASTDNSCKIVMLLTVKTMLRNAGSHMFCKLVLLQFFPATACQRSNSVSEDNRLSLRSFTFRAGKIPSAEF